MDAYTSYAPNYTRQCVELLSETAADNVVVLGSPGKTGLMGQGDFSRFSISVCYWGVLAATNPRYFEVLCRYGLSGCWPREIFDRFGMFDEELVRESRTMNLTCGLRAAAEKSGSRRASSAGITPASHIQFLFRQQMQYGYWKVRVIQKHKIPASVRHIVPACFVFSLIWLTLASLWWPPAAWSLLLLVGTYLTFNIGASLLPQQAQLGNSFRSFRSCSPATISHTVTDSCVGFAILSCFGAGQVAHSTD